MIIFVIITFIIIPWKFGIHLKQKERLFGIGVFVALLKNFEGAFIYGAAGLIMA
jgi:hypothetical protein